MIVVCVALQDVNDSASTASNGRQVSMPRNYDSVQNLFAFSVYLLGTPV